MTTMNAVNRDLI